MRDGEGVCYKPDMGGGGFFFFFFFFFLREAEFQDEARNSREGSAGGALPASGVKGVIRGGDRKGAPEGGGGEGSGWARREE